MFDGGHAPLSKASSKPSSHPAFLALVGRAVSNAGRAAAQAPRSVATPHAARGPVSHPSVFHALAHAIGNAGQSVSHAAHSASTPHTGLLTAGQSGGPPASAVGRGLLMQAFGRELAALQSQGLSPWDAKAPSLTFDRTQPKNAAMYVLHALGGNAIPTIHVTPEFSSLTGSAAHDMFVRRALLHEFAHTQQSPATLSQKATAEGGAQAWTDLVGRQVIPHETPTSLTGNPSRDGGYAGYVGQVTTREGMPWVKHGQFDKNASLPSINAPNTRAGRNALRSLGAVSGNAVAQAGVKANGADYQALLARLERPGLKKPTTINGRVYYPQGYFH